MLYAVVVRIDLLDNSSSSKLPVSDYVDNRTFEIQRSNRTISRTMVELCDDQVAAWQSPNGRYRVVRSQ